MPNGVAREFPFSAQRREWFESAKAHISAQRLQRLLASLTDIHSPTGKERQASEFMVSHLRDAGLQARYQPVTDSSGNCIAHVKGAGGGASLMLYAPIDTHLDANETVDLPWVGPELRADMRPVAQISDDLVIGLGASNPKSMLCTLVEAILAVLESGAKLRGDLILATCGGGMPWLTRGSGISSGVKHMLSQGPRPDCGIIFKPGDEVYFEHPGMCWIKVVIHGTMGYAGLPRGIPGFRSSIVPAANVVVALEKWLREYPDRHQSVQVRPEGWISAVRSGWPEKPAFPSAATEVYIDLRTNPDQTCESAYEELRQFLRALTAREPDLEITSEMYATCEASRTESQHWIVRSARRGWEERYGKPYPGAPLMSGQTDAATICAMGVPLVRIGYPFAVRMPEKFAEGLGGMGVARISDLIGPCESVIYSVIDTCTRLRGEMGL
jgi:acetylornithine deacetylase/succinyl-diaminopimelate desuccinylase-like protein